MVRDQAPSRLSGMTVAEATRIVQQFEAGALDPGLPGTMELVNEARRIGVAASMWGTEGGRPQRARARRLVIACCAIAALTCTGLTLVFVTAR